MSSHTTASATPKLSRLVTRGLGFVAALVLTGAAGAPAGVATVAAAPSAPSTERVSLDTHGNEANANSFGSPAVSADGRFVAFASAASTLVPGDTNGSGDVFVRDRQNGVTERVSVDSAGNEANGASPPSPAISGDGRFVAFPSDASNLVPGDINGWTDIFVHDRDTGTTERVSVTGAEGEGDLFSFGPVDISAGGRYVAFASNASNLTPDDTNGFFGDVFVRDRETGSTELVSLDSAGHAGRGDSGSFLDLSATGRFVAFASSAADLVSQDTNNASDVFIRDRQSGTTERVSVDGGGGEGNDASSAVATSANGRLVAFTSDATSLVPDDTNGRRDVFVRDRQAETTERASVASAGDQANCLSFSARISDDGRYVAFDSCASNLSASDANGTDTDVFVRDRQLGTTGQASVGGSGAGANGGSFAPALSATGRYVAFTSGASNLVPGDANNAVDVFLRDRGLRSSIDQSNLIADEQAPSINAVFRRAQTFTAGASGLLDQVDVAVARSSPGVSAPLEVQIQEVVEGTPTSGILTATTIPASLVPTLFDIRQAEFLPIPLPSPIELNAGSQYAIVLRSTQDPSTGYMWVTGTAYPGGTGLTNEGMFNGGAWYQEAFDFAFRTYVAAPASDVDPPTLVLPGDVVAEATGPNGATVTFDVSATDDADPSPEITCSPPSGTLFGLGTTPVTCSAVDDAGHRSTGEFAVTVQDTTAPEVTAALDPLGGGDTEEERRFVARWTCTDLVDANPGAAGTVNGISVPNLTEVRFKPSFGRPSARLTRSGVLEVKGSLVELKVSCVDAAGNAGSGLATASTAVDLGTLGGSSSAAVAVTDRGQVVGSSSTAEDVETHAFVWTERDGMQDLGTLGGAFSQAVAASDSGQVIGGSSTVGDAETHAFSWTESAGMRDLGTLGGTSSWGVAMNDAGQVVGYSSGPGDTETRAFSWTERTGMVDLGTLGGDWSQAQAVNASGQVAGASYTAGDAETHAFLWTARDGMVDLGTLGGTVSWASAMNTEGEVIGYSSTADDAATHAFLWTKQSGMVDLGTLGGTYSQAIAVNADGQVTGYSSLPGEAETHAFSWTKHGGMVDLGSLGGTFSYVNTAAALSDRGHIVGVSSTPGDAQIHAFLWTQQGGLLDLGGLGGSYSQADAMNANGQIVGISSLANEEVHAALWQLNVGDLEG